MPTYSKIPKKVKELGAVAGGRYAVFASLLAAGEVITELQKLESKRKTFPAVGYMQIKGKRYYYCPYGMVDDPSIYE